MSLIVRPVTKDGCVGYDQFNQFVCEIAEAGRTATHFIHDVRDEKCKVCNRSWKPNAKSMHDQMDWRGIGYVHESCYVRYQSIRERLHFQGILYANKVKWKNFKEIPNQYWPRSYRISKKPWYTVEMADFPVLIRLGSRKRVHHIEFQMQGPDKFKTLDAVEEAFKDINVTKEFCGSSCMIHSYNDEDDRRYMEMILDALSLRSPEEQGHYKAVEVVKGALT